MVTTVHKGIQWKKNFYSNSKAFWSATTRHLKSKVLRICSNFIELTISLSKASDHSGLDCIVKKSLKDFQSQSQDDHGNLIISKDFSEIHKSKRHCMCGRKKEKSFQNIQELGESAAKRIRKARKDPEFLHDFLRKDNCVYRVLIQLNWKESRI